MKKYQAIAVVLFMLVAGVGLVNAFHDGDHGEGPMDTTFKVNKKGEVNIERDVKIGTYLVKRGKYMLTHQINAERHSFVLDELNKKKQPSELTRYELDSQFISHPARVKDSLLSVIELLDHSLVVSKIQIAGENGDHIFSRNVGGNNANASKN